MIPTSPGDEPLPDAGSLVPSHSHSTTPSPSDDDLPVAIPDDPEAAVDLAEAWLRLGRFADVERACRLVFDRDRRNLRARGFLGVAVAHQSRPDEALKLLARAPDRPEVHFARAIAHEQLGEYAEAEAPARQALALAPDEPDCHHLLGSILAQQLRYSEALAEFARALQLNPDHEPSRQAGDRLRLSQESGRP